MWRFAAPGGMWIQFRCFPAALDWGGFRSHVKVKWSQIKWVEIQTAIDVLQKSFPSARCVCYSLTTALPALLWHKHTFRWNDFFLHLFKNTPHHIYNADNDPSWRTPFVWLAKRVGGESGGEKNIWSKSSTEAAEIIGAGHRLWCHVVLLLSLAGCDTKTARRARR